MKPLRIRIDRITDLGSIVSLKGIDTETAEPVSIHIDHRPSASFWEAWRAAGCPEPIEYEADQLILHLDLRPAEVIEPRHRGQHVAHAVRAERFDTAGDHDATADTLAAELVVQVADAPRL